MRLSVVLLLLKTYVKGTKPISHFTSRFGFGKNKKVRILSSLIISLFMLVALMMLVFLFGMNYYNYQIIGMMMGIDHIGIMMGIAVAMITIIIFATPGAINALHTAKDIERLRVLAISEGELALSRMIIFYGYFFPLYLLFITPALGVGIMSSGFSLVYALGSLSLIFFGPIIPLSIATLIEIGVVYLTKGRRTQRTGEFIYLTVMMVFVIGITSQMGRQAQIDGDIQSLMGQLGPIIMRIHHLLSPFKLFALGLYHIPSLLAWLSVTTLLALLTFTLTSRTYHHCCSLLASSGYQKKRRNNTSTSQRGPISALMKRDWTILLSSSGFIFELGGELLIPLILLITYSAMGMMGDILSTIHILAQYPLFEPILILLLLLFANINLLSSTSVSRQGELATHDRLYPLEAHTFVKAKVTLHLLVVGSANIIYLVVITLLFNISFTHFVMYVILSLLSIVGTSYVHLAIDYHNPLLNWTSSRQAMKRNPNGLIGMVISLVLVVWIGLFLVGVPYFFNLSTTITHFITLIVALVTMKGAQILAYKSATNFMLF
ncbi:MAG: hypothetical protein ACOX0W_07005 [Sphaerochaetaceae bacterium]|jgi:ABC-2 type transport system permease protein